MKGEVVIALITKIVEEHVANTILSLPPGVRGQRGFRGPIGETGSSFVWADHELEIRSLIKEAALKFSDLTPEQIESLKGASGEKGEDGNSFVWEEHERVIRAIIKDYSIKFSDLTVEEVNSLKGEKGETGETGESGKSFVFDEHQETIKEIIKSHALKFSDLTVEEFESLRGRAGRDGRNGRDGENGQDGKGFEFDDHRENMAGVICEELRKLSSVLKLTFSDLTPDEIEMLRGPRGQRGKAGRDFIFEEHKEEIENLLKEFSELTPEKIELLKLKFSDLRPEDRNSLKLRFSDLTEEDMLSLKGQRGSRGQRGAHGIAGEKGDAGENGLRGPRGPVGPKGIDARPAIDGKDGVDGKDGEDAPTIQYFSVIEEHDEISFKLTLSNGHEYETAKIKMPSKNVGIVAVVGNASSGGSSTPAEAAVLLEYDRVSSTIAYSGFALTGTDTDEALWGVRRITKLGGGLALVEFADGDRELNNIWDDRATLTYLPET